MALDTWGGTSEGSIPFVPTRDFERVTGLRGVNLGESEYGGVYLTSSVALSSGDRQGAVSATKWEATEEHGAGSGLGWCVGADCDRFWCNFIYGTTPCTLSFTP
jgi:hypothetical protein